MKLLADQPRRVAAYYSAIVDEIALRYPSLKLADIYAVFSYYLQRQPEVGAYLEQRQQQVTRVRAEKETRFKLDGICARLLVRRAARES